MKALKTWYTLICCHHNFNCYLKTLYNTKLTILKKWTLTMERPFLSLSHLQTVIVLLRWFYKSFLQIFRKIHGKESSKYSKMQVSNNFQIIPLNWVRNYRTLNGKTNGFIKPLTKGQYQFSTVIQSWVNWWNDYNFYDFCLKYFWPLKALFPDIRKSFLLLTMTKVIW